MPVRSSDVDDLSSSGVLESAQPCFSVARVLPIPPDRCRSKPDSWVASPVVLCPPLATVGALTSSEQTLRRGLPNHRAMTVIFLRMVYALEGRSVFQAIDDLGYRAVRTDQRS